MDSRLELGVVKVLALILLALCAIACSDERGAYGRVKVPDGLEIRLAGSFTARINKSTRDATIIRMTYRGRAIRYQEGALYVDDQRLILPAAARVVAFDGPNIYVDGRNVASR